MRGTPRQRFVVSVLIGTVIAFVLSVFAMPPALVPVASERLLGDAMVFVIIMIAVVLLAYFIAYVPERS